MELQLRAGRDGAEGIGAAGERAVAQLRRPEDGTAADEARYREQPGGPGERRPARLRD
jgi:hypothetical protein